jgi:hypothetical protein
MTEPRHPKTAFLSIALLTALAALCTGCPAKPPSSPNEPIVYNPWDGNPDPSEPINGTYGFDIQPYPGTSMSSVILWVRVSQNGSYSYSVSAKDNSSNASIGTASSGSVSLVTTGAYYAPVTFPFSGNLGVTKGDTIAFTVSLVSSPGGSTSAFCQGGTNAGNTTVTATSNGNPLAGTGIAVVVDGNS